MAEAIFYYRAIGPQGKIETGQITAASAAAASGKLVRAGQRPLRVQAKPIKAGLLQQEISFTSKKLGLAEAQSFSRDMAIMLGSGLELYSALDLVGSALAPKSQLAGFVETVSRSVGLGTSFSESIRASGYRTPEEFVSVLTAAENAGGLIEAFNMLDVSYSQRLDLRQKLVGAAAYPAFLVFAAGAALTIIALFVAPSLAGLFASLDRPLPLAMKLLVEIPAVLQANWLTIVAGLSALVLAGIAASRFPPLRERMRAITFKLPLIGSLLVWAATSRFAGMLHLAVVNNIPIAEATASAWRISGFPFAGTTAAAVGESIRRGQRLADAAQRLTYLPPSAKRLLAAGDATNRLPQVLMTVEQEAQRQVTHRATMLTSLMAPVLIVLVGSLIGTLVFSVFSALLDVSRLTY